MAILNHDSLAFFDELALNNNREWFEANKQRYFDQVRNPLLSFIADMDTAIKTISSQYVGDTRVNGGSLFRIYRDVRFSKDKTPYKTWAGLRFKHQASPTHPAPTFYLHIQPGYHFMGAGIWHPPAPVLNRIREFIHNNPRSWQQLQQHDAFQRVYSFGGDSLKRIPRGYESDHLLGKDLKRKDFVLSTPLSNRQLLADEFNATFLDNCQIAAPFVDYLCAALELEF